MAKNTRKATTTRKEIATKSSSRSLKVGRRGIRTSLDFAQFMSGLMSDVVAGDVDPRVGNAACNAGGKLLKVIEMQYKFARPNSQPAGTNQRVLRLSE